jgi:23S rRNA pseudouridine955/2504/2580 synthase
MKRIEVLYEDESCLGINKPAGLAVQGGSRVGISLDKILAENWPQRPLLIHRLDQDTSGVILVAKNQEAAARLSRLLGEDRNAAGGGKAVIKQYLAVCAGQPPAKTGVIRFNLAIRGSVKKSETRYRLLAKAEQEGFSLLELELGTGRTHQIRRHLAIAGNPVLGDDKYGDFTLNKRLRKTMNLRRLLLHASRLVVSQPDNGLHLDISAPLPDYFSAFLERIWPQPLRVFRQG